MIFISDPLNISDLLNISNFKILILKHHAIFIEGLCVTFRERKEPISTKVLGKARREKNHCEL